MRNKQASKEKGKGGKPFPQQEKGRGITMFNVMNDTTVKMFNLYESTAAHDRIALFFTLEKRVYMSIVDALKIEWIETDYQLDNETGEYVPALRLNMRQIDFLRLRDFYGAKCFGFEKEFFKEWNKEEENKGEFIERRFVEMFHAKASRKNTPYYEKGDCELFGEQIQIKAQRATLARYETIIRAAKLKGL